MILINNYLDFKNFITNLDYKPTLLLHACCAPCSTHCLMVLKKYFDITIFYSNDNIYPEEEYNKRLVEIKNFCEAFDIKIKVLDDGYNHQDFLDAIKGKEELGERSERCYNCYLLRLEKSVIKAKKLGFEYFTTTLSLSPFKNSHGMAYPTVPSSLIK